MPQTATPEANATIQALNTQVARLQSTPAPTSAAPAAPTAPPTPTAAPTLAPAPTLAASPTTPSLADSIALVKSYTVYIWTNEGSGSGVSLGNGQVLTAFHVVQGASSINARFADGRQEPIRPVRVDSRRDLALLQTSFTDVPAAKLSDARTLRDGDSLIAVGYPRSDAIGARDTTVTRGIASGRWQSPTGVWYVQTDTPTNPGNSGGPLTDEQGQVLGLITFGVRQAVGLNFAVASDEVQAFLNGQNVTASAPSPGPANVQLNPNGISPSTAVPATVLTLGYDVTFDGQPLTVVLGASIRPTGGTWISDPLADIRVTLQPGQSRFTRQFHVPPDAQPGSYDVAWGLLGTDMQTSYGLVSQPAALMVVANPSRPTTSASLTAAMARVSQEGYRASDTSMFDPAMQLRVLIGVAATSADGANQRAFFFVGDRYLGTDAADPSARVMFVRQSGNIVTLRYALFKPADAQCCPTGGSTDVRFSWDGTKLSPLDPIPPADAKSAGSRR